LVLNLLNLSRIESGETHLEIKAVEVADVFQACERLEKHAAEAHGQNLVVIKPAKTLLAQADRSALRRVLCILIENAVKFTADGGRITLEAEISANGEIKIKVADNGCGIAEKDLPFIFDKFYQGTMTENADDFDIPTEKAEASGVGLGLYLAKTLVEKMNGSLTAESTVGVGSVFTMTLPAWRENAAEKQLERKNEQAVISG
jgi:signal transduction histidine kinase